MSYSITVYETIDGDVCMITSDPCDARDTQAHSSVPLQDLLVQYCEKEPDRLAAMQPAMGGLLERLIGEGPGALLISAGTGWAWGRDLPAAAWLLQVCFSYSGGACLAQMFV